MNFRQTAILLGGVLVVGVLLLILTWTTDGPTTDFLMEELVRANVKAADIDTVEIERDGRASSWSAPTRPGPPRPGRSSNRTACRPTRPRSRPSSRR